MSGAEPVATVIWRRLDVPGMEYFVLKDGDDGRRLEGTVFSMEDGIPSRLDYEIVCSRDWATQSVSASFEQEGATRAIELKVDNERRWWSSEGEVRDLAGQIDVDLSLTPATNIFPMLRLGIRDLPIGETREATAAFVLFPRMNIEPLRQQYTKIADRTFAYENLDGSFTTEIEIDHLGIVVSYPPFWERVAIVHHIQIRS